MKGLLTTLICTTLIKHKSIPYLIRSSLQATQDKLVPHALTQVLSVKYIFLRAHLLLRATERLPGSQQSEQASNLVSRERIDCNVEHLKMGRIGGKREQFG